MKRNWKHYNWAFLGAIIGCASFWIAIAVGIAFLLTSCATEKQLHEREVRTIVADMLASQSQTDTHSHSQTLNVDSMVSQSVRTAFAEWQRPF